MLGGLPVPLWVIESRRHHQAERPIRVPPGIWPRLPGPEGPPALLSGSPLSGVFLLPAGSTVYTCMLNHCGGTESDLTVSRLAPGPQASPLAPAFEGERCPGAQQRPDGSLAQ